MTPCASPNQLLSTPHPVILPLNTLIPVQLRHEVRVDIDGIMLILVSLPKDLDSDEYFLFFSQKRDLQDAAFFFFLPSLLYLLETFVNVAFLLV